MLVDEFGHAIDVQENTLGAQLGAALVAIPGDEAVSVDVDLVLAVEEVELWRFANLFVIQVD